VGTIDVQASGPSSQAIWRLAAATAFFALFQASLSRRPDKRDYSSFCIDGHHS
jgi:hypothetical protein